MKEEQFNKPVTIIVFNRPEYTRKLIESLRLTSPKELFIIADGPRNKGEEKKCKEVRNIIESMVDWPCKIHKDYSDINMGVKSRIESGITNVFEIVDETIILEDDCIPSKSFFYFCEKMLDLYRNEKDIAMISGDNPIYKNFKTDSDYMFSKYFAIWGWATWKRAWKIYDDNMPDWKKFKKIKSIFKIIRHLGASIYLKELFSKARNKKINSWATIWFYNCLTQNHLSIIPKYNLVSNIGVEGVHSSPGDNNNVTAEEMEIRNIKIRDKIIWDHVYDMAFFKKNFKLKLIPKPKEIILKTLVRIKKILIK